MPTMTHGGAGLGKVLAITFAATFGASAPIVMAEADAPATSTVIIPSTAGPKHPCEVGHVRAGQEVTITVGKVLWKGGGSKGSAFTNWRGYPERYEKNGLPWMALCAGVGRQLVAAKEKEFTFTVAQEGTLVVFANDDKPDGNAGKGEVTVTVKGNGNGNAVAAAAAPGGTFGAAGSYPSDCLDKAQALMKTTWTWDSSGGNHHGITTFTADGLALDYPGKNRNGDWRIESDGTLIYRRGDNYSIVWQLKETSPGNYAGAGIAGSARNRTCTLAQGDPLPGEKR